MSNFVHDTQKQAFYDAFNTFIFSGDTKILAKLISKYEFLKRTAHLPGDIVELGVYKGSGMMTWLKMLNLTSVNQKHVFGFDLFDEEALLQTLQGSQREVMDSLFKDRNFTQKDSYEEKLKSMLSDAGFERHELVKGNVLETIPQFLNDYPGFRASVINFDLDVDEPTFFALEQLWPRLVVGGIAIFDEYALKEWDESNAVDRFCAEHKLELKYTGYAAPTAFIIKEQYDTAFNTG